MTQLEFVQKNIKVGTYKIVNYKTETKDNNGMVVAIKTTRCIVRFLGDKNNLVKINKQGEEYVHLYLTNCKYHIPQINYWLVDNNGVKTQTTKEDYEMVQNKKPQTITKVFSKHLSDIISID